MAVFFLYYVLYLINSHLVQKVSTKMEARGVEPLSEGNVTQASTGVVTDLMSPE